MAGREQRVKRPPETLLKVADAAQMLGISTKTLYQWSGERRIPSVKLMGRALRFKLSDLEKLIRKWECPALSELP